MDECNYWRDSKNHTPTKLVNKLSNLFLVFIRFNRRTILTYKIQISLNFLNFLTKPNKALLKITLEINQTNQALGSSCVPDLHLNQ